jgi:hypothetical protein
MFGHGLPRPLNSALVKFQTTFLAWNALTRVCRLELCVNDGGYDRG